MNKNLAALKAAFPFTLPVLAGYIFMGAAFGMLLQSRGWGVFWVLGMSLFIYAGSLQFVAVGILAGGFRPVEAVLIALMVNARHIFYGLPLLGEFGGMGKERAYMIFSLTDETFSLLCSVKPPVGAEKNSFYFCIAALNHFYWITGSLAGFFAGAAVEMKLKGLDFVMTALFTVIFLKQWERGAGRKPALLGVGAGIVCRCVFGAQWFIIPAMGLILLVLTLARFFSARGEKA
ncbi:MAG: AzlC family ABC transporter permease [Spirochaetales bacterium]|jgi:4-azaleucine resistance transporter AzlC|nr:AzlC family ABC transporter permease [Spirochaetales bacterium]